jgi:hypothetical protein
MMIFKTMFISGVCILAAAQAEVLPQINAAYAFKDLTVSGLLLAAVVFLYRELGRERKKTEEVAGSAKTFIEEQTVLMQAAAKEQSAALGQVASALESLEASSREQIDIHRTHVKAIIESALPVRKLPP